MENAADALKLAFSIFVFMLAFTILFHYAALARETAETIVLYADKSTYYTYIPDDTTDILVPSIHNNVKVINRIVTLEDMIPTIYRYSIESYGVTIIDKDGNIVTRFDKETENLCSSFNSPGVTDKNKNDLITEINSYVLEPVEAKKINSISELKALFERIYKQDNSGNSDFVTFECPWHGSRKYRWLDSTKN